MGRVKELFIQARNEYIESLPQEKKDLLDAVIHKRFLGWTNGTLTAENTGLKEWEELGKPLNKNRWNR